MARKVGVTKWNKYAHTDEEFVFGDNSYAITVSVKAVLDIPERVALCNAVVEECVKDGVFNRPVFDDVFHAYAMSLYTNLNMDTEIDKSNKLRYTELERRIFDICGKDYDDMRDVALTMCNDASNDEKIAWKKIGDMIDLIGDVVNGTNDQINNILIQAVQDALKK